MEFCSAIETKLRAEFTKLIHLLEEIVFSSLDITKPLFRH